MTELRALPQPRNLDLHSGPSIRWGVIAPGGIARGFTHALHAGTNSRVIAVGSRDQDRARSFADDYAIPRAYGSYTELVADTDIDAVYVASPHSEHFEHVSLALEAGKPVLVEKAFTRNVAEAKKLIELAASKNLLLMEAMWTRYLPHIDVLRQLLEAGELGEIKLVTANHGQLMNFPDEHRLMNPNLAGGALLDLGVYPISFTQFVLGTPHAISATGRLTHTGVDASVAIELQYETADALLHTTQRARTSTTAEVAGTSARVFIDSDFYRPTNLTLTYPKSTELKYESGYDPSLGLAFQAVHFAKLLQAGKLESDLQPLSDTLAVMQTMDTIREIIGVRYPNE
jgi:predicted dehydrogenase